jgi:basic membrane protein A
MLFVGLAAGTGNFLDRSYNDMLFTGMMNAKIKLNINFIEDSPATFDDAYYVIRGLLDRGVNVILAAGGWYMVDPVDVLAREYPDVLFVLFDDYAKEYLPNVASVTFKQNEVSFLAGALAAMQSRTEVVGVIGAIDVPSINDFIVGYEAGARYYNPRIRILKDYIFNHDKQRDPFSNSQVAYNIARDMYQSRNVDVIFQVAGGSGMGVFSAAQSYGRYAIGVYSDQDYLAEGYILTSVIKRVDKAIEKVIQKILNHEKENKAYIMCFKDDFITLSDMQFTKNLISEQNQRRLENIKKQIINGQIIVPTTQKIPK